MTLPPKIDALPAASAARKVSERPAKEERGGAQRDHGEPEQKGNIGRNGQQAGVLENQLLEPMHRVGERIHRGDACSGPHRYEVVS